MRIWGILALIFCPITAVAQNWMPMDAAAIRTALTDRQLQYRDARQSFRASGRTVYNAGADRWGQWRVQNDQYCSQWPPSDLWACYDLEQDGDRLRFVGQGGETTEASYVD